ncbi:MAG: amidohydrolase family protein [Polyangiales bacterium]|nr:amidohydrolase family protein [Myxococcales bacterium]MCB9660686.1 amidohydrolase family protein [Sandaracinaceae bacterium]
MALPPRAPVIDLMLGIPSLHQKESYDFMRPLFRDAESLRSFDFPAEYMFKDFPRIGPQDDYAAYTVSLMDAVGIRAALLGVSAKNEVALRALRDYPTRFVPEMMVSANGGMEAVRELERMDAQVDLAAVSAFPSGYFPQVPLADKAFYPLYACMVERGLPFFVCVGVPGPRIPMAPQLVEQLDELCWAFPELKVVMRHGAEPWTDLAVKLMLKYPNLYYSTSAFAPRHYPRAIIDYANTRGADKVMYAGYFPAGLTLARIFDELPSVPFADHVWPKFLYQNATRVLRRLPTDFPVGDQLG